jgi:hypothetical protein
MLRAVRGLLVVALCAPVAACFEEVPIVPVSVALKVMPMTGGTSYVAIDTTGRVQGGHMSGGPRPTVREDSSRVPKALAAELFAEVAALGDTLLRRAPVTIMEPPGTRQIAILFNDDSQVRIVWPLSREHPDDRVNRLALKLMNNRVGGW